MLKKTTWKSEKKDKKRLEKRDCRSVSVQFMATFDCVKKSGSLSPQNGMFSGCRWRNGLQIWRISVADS